MRSLLYLNDRSFISFCSMSISMTLNIFCRDFINFFAVNNFIQWWFWLGIDGQLYKANCLFRQNNFGDFFIGFVIRACIYWLYMQYFATTCGICSMVNMQSEKCRQVLSQSMNSSTHLIRWTTAGESLLIPVRIAQITWWVVFFLESPKCFSYAVLIRCLMIFQPKINLLDLSLFNK